MKVHYTDGNHIQQAHGGKKASHTAKASAAEEAARAKAAAVAAEHAGHVKPEISARAKEMSHAKSVAKNAAEVREEKIAALKKAIAEGHYHIKPDAIADRMVDDHLKSGIG